MEIHETKEFNLDEYVKRMAEIAPSRETLLNAGISIEFSNRYLNSFLFIKEKLIQVLRK